MKDTIKSLFTAADRTAIQQLINDLETACAGKTASISDSERSRYGSVNEQNKLVVNKARDYHSSQPALSTPMLTGRNLNRITNHGHFWKARSIA